MTFSNIPLHTHHFAEDALNAILVNLKAIFQLVVKRIESNQTSLLDSKYCQHIVKIQDHLAVLGLGGDSNKQDKAENLHVDLEMWGFSLGKYMRCLKIWTGRLQWDDQLLKDFRSCC